MDSAEGRDMANTCSLSSSSFDGRRLNELLSSWKSRNSSSFNSGKFQRPTLHDKNSCTVGASVSSGGPHSKKAQPQCPGNPHPLGLDRNMNPCTYISTSLSCDTIGWDVVPEVVIASAAKSISTSSNADELSVGSCSSPENPTDCLYSYSQYFLLLQSDENKIQSSPSLLGCKATMRHFNYESHQQRIRMSLDYYLSMWEQKQQEEDQVNINKVSAFSNERNKTHTSKCTPKSRRKHRHFTFLASIILLLLLCIHCFFSQFLAFHMRDFIFWARNCRNSYLTSKPFFSEVLSKSSNHSIHHIIPDIKQLPTDISLNFQRYALQSMEGWISSVISKTKEQEINVDTVVISSRALEGQVLGVCYETVIFTNQQVCVFDEDLSPERTEAFGIPDNIFHDNYPLHAKKISASLQSTRYDFTRERLVDNDDDKDEAKVECVRSIASTISTAISFEAEPERNHLVPSKDENFLEIPLMETFGEFVQKISSRYSNHAARFQGGIWGINRFQQKQKTCAFGLAFC